MSGKSHAAIGINALWVFAAIYGYGLSPFLIPLVVIGALLPDLDAPNSKLLNWGIGWGRGKNRIVIRPFAIPWAFMHGLFKHRGFWHSLVANLIILILSLLVVGYINQNYIPLDPIFAFVVPAGYLTHLLADAMTHYGVPFFWPVPDTFHITPKPFWFTTGTPIDDFIFAIAMLGVFFLLTKMIPELAVIDINHFLPEVR